MRHGVLPRTLNADLPCPPLTAGVPGPVRLLVEPTPWPRTARIRRAAVSAFGISGTNAHVILQEPPATPTLPAGVDERPVPWVLSARSAPALRTLATRLEPVTQSAGPLQAGRALATTRATFDHRAVLVAPDRDELRAGLRAVADGTASADVVTGRARPVGRTVFVFPGQGGQWAGMAADLLADSEVFARALAACDRALAPHVGFSVLAVLRGEAGRPSLEGSEVTQCSLFAVMVALAELWKSFGVRPDAVVGHSQGEIAAACVSGALSLEDAARVVARRAAAVSELAGGRMAAVALPRDELAAHLAVSGGRLSLAADNGPHSTVVSGRAAAVATLLDELGGRGVRTTVLAVDYASHCTDVARVEDRLLRDLDGIQPLAAEVPFFSTVVPGVLDSTELTARYWYRNLRRPVEFQRAVRSLLEAGHTTFIEVSPHPVLIQSILETADAAGRAATAIGTLWRDQGGRRRLLRSAAEAYVTGVPVSWDAAFAGAPAGHVELPCYPFQHERYWLPSGPMMPRPGPAPTTPAPPADRGPVPSTKPALLALVRDHTALVLGHPDRTGIDPDAAFAALGTGSLAAVELRTRLSRTLDLPLPAAVTLDHDTPRALAAHLWHLLRDRAAPPPSSKPSPRELLSPPRPLNPPELPDTLDALYRHACRTGRGEAAIELIGAAAQLRPTFAAASAAEHAPEPVRLGTTGTGPALMCLPSVLPTSGPHEYTRLADSLRGARHVLVLPQPGFTARKPLPHDLDALIAAHTTALARHAASAPFLLCGYSSGGLLAHAVAARLEELGRPANGLVLLDTYWPAAALWAELLPRLLSSSAVTEQALASGISTDRLTATGGYLRLLTRWQPTPIRTPTLLLRATEPIPDITPDGPRTTPWQLPHTELAVPGDHFTMLTDHAAALADAIGRWQDTIAVGPPGPRTPGPQPT